MSQEKPEEFSEESVEEQAEEIVRGGSRIAEQVSSLLLGAVRASDSGLDRFTDFSESVMRGALKSVDTATPENPENTLRKVFDGVNDAAGRAAESLRLTLEEARARSEVFAEDEVKRTAEKLGDLEAQLLETLQDFAKKSQSEFSTQLENIIEHTKRTGAGMRPSIEAALQAAAEQPKELLSESVQAGAELTKQVTGTLLGGMASYLEKASKSLTGEKD